MTTKLFRQDKKIVSTFIIKAAAANAVAAVLALAAYLAFQLVFTTTILRWSKGKL